MTQRNSLLRKTWIALCAAALLGVSGHALADHKNLPGMLCTEANDSTPDVDFTFSNGVRNVAASTISLICPAVRDDVSSAMDVGDWDIGFHRHNHAGAWQVLLWSLDQTGSSGFISIIDVPAAPANGWGTADGGSITSAYASAPMAVTSQLPPGAELLWYEIDETGTTDN